MRVEDINSIKIKVASPEEILSWSHGEVTKAETINYRTQRPEKDGLFCEKIFGPEKDFQCYCGKYRGIRYKGIVCDRCGVEATKASVRRERMGHIKLASPCSHIWFLRGVPSIVGTLLELSSQQLEKIVYFASYIITSVDEKEKKKILIEIEKEYQEKSKIIKSKYKDKKLSKTKEKEFSKETKALKKARDRAKKELSEIVPFRALSEIEYLNYSSKYGQIFNADTGAGALRDILKGFKLAEMIDELKEESSKVQGILKKKLLKRAELLKKMEKEKIGPEWLFLSILPVLPPALRPMVQLDGGRYASSDLNDLYRRIINRNNRLKYLLEISAPEVILRNEKRMLQEAVDALIDNSSRSGHTTMASTGQARLLKSLADMLKGKQGRFRQNLLGKRVDYSGRSVIVGDPGLKFSECGLPKKMALELFKPFVSAKLLEKEIVYNVRQASNLIERGEEEVWEALESIIQNKVVMLNRAPTLHRLGIQAFRPKLVEGEAIRIHPLVCEAFNADFDGDQMAVFVPLSDEAQKETRERLLSGFNLLKPATGMPVVSPRQDMVLGCYWLTKIKNNVKGEGKIFSSADEAHLAYESGVIDIRAMIKVLLGDNIIETSLGRIIFNEALPKDFPFQNEKMNSSKIKHITRTVIQTHENNISVEVLDKIKKIGFEYATLSGLSWGMDDLVIPKEKAEMLKQAELEIKKIEDYFKKGLLTEGERKAQVIEVWQKVKARIQELVPGALPEEGIVFTSIDAGARGSWSQPVQMAGMKGLVINPGGEIMEFPAKSCFKEGFDVLEYFISTHGARKGTADTALRTSTAGYLTRRLIDVAHDYYLSEEDCKDKEGITISREDGDAIGQNFIFKIVSRFTLEDVKHNNEIIVKKGEIIGWEEAKQIDELKIAKLKVRSPLSCQSRSGICQKCYGWDLGTNKLVRLGEAVGIIAAQAIGEPGTQLTLRTFHTGGVASAGDITHGLPRVEEVFESRKPKGEAIIVKRAGKIISIEENIIKIKSKEESKKDKKKVEKKSVPDKTDKNIDKKEDKKGEIIEYEMPTNRTFLVNAGDEVKAGQRLCEGNIDPKKLFKVSDRETTAKYLVGEVQKIYASQGVDIHDKHIEVIVRQMFSRIRIKKKGDSRFSVGEVKERRVVLEENARLKKENKVLAVSQDLLLGMSKISLTTESFLSAASFEQTSRVLIQASVTGKEDYLRGLKENVIIGKLIPVGTGYRGKK
ncbi:DNA-directed RNA polymerase subunit beta' [Patescibacteria group bacterium]|nr:DNA-directed RNA polymerase subunit beta' [Patescibacteria group bacterium]MBU4078545.1 DNA-directed RNA polymerase subunit beta' [Patescibacteria group bacterium]